MREKDERENRSERAGSEFRKDREKREEKDMLLFPFLPSHLFPLFLSGLPASNCTYRPHLRPLPSPLLIAFLWNQLVANTGRPAEDIGHPPRCVRKFVGCNGKKRPSL